ncbi:MAG: hypothetical protein HQL94_09035, partial [Magnetococcales bacterium]|nr:hypothetical protein [Magnetococcales bacterium]
KISKSDNEIMSRQTGDCFAQVTFKSHIGHYCCTWSQRRARDKASGALQQPSHEIVDADTNTILESKITAVAKYVELVTGMDFDRFSRSMLLAQGKFASFLQANPGDRAEILEQITGTEVYSQISKRVHERRGEEQKKRDSLEEACETIQLLEEEKEWELSRNLVYGILLDEALINRSRQTEQALAWLNRLAGLESEIQFIQEGKLAWQQKWEAFAPRRERLLRANKAQEWTASHAKLKMLRQAQGAEQIQQDACVKRVPEAKERVRQAEESMNLAKTLLEQKKVEQKMSAVVIRQARELDVGIREKMGPIREADRELGVLKKQFDAARVEQEKECKVLADQRGTLAEVVKTLSVVQMDAGLVEHLTGICSRMDVLKGYHAQLIAKVAVVGATQGQLERFTRLWQERDAAWTQWKEKLAITHKSLTDQEIALKKALIIRRNILETEKTINSEQLLGQETKLVSLTQERDTLESHLATVKVIQSYDKARTQLQDGLACPLCGSTEHPFTMGTVVVPVSDEIATELKRVRDELKRVNDTVNALHIAQGKVTAALEQVVARLQLYSDEEMDESVNTPVLAVDVLEKEIGINRDALEKIKESVVKTELERADAAMQKEVTAQKRLREEQEIAELQKKCAELLTELEQELVVYGVVAPSPTILDKIRVELTKKRDQWVALNHQKITLETEISKHKINIEHRAGLINKQDNDIKIKNQFLVMLQQDLDLLKKQRFEQFGDKNPDVEETRLAIEVEVMEKEVHSANARWESARIELSKLESRLVDLVRSMAERRGSLDQEESTFLRGIRESGFEDEKDFKASCLQENERNSLTSIEKQLSNEEIELRTKENEKRGLLENEQQKRVTDQPRESLKGVLNACETKQRDLQWKIGEIRQQLKSNDDLKQTQLGNLRNLEVQKRECQRWELLHDLIGSADGQKYRNFVQGLTFERVLKNANQQLKWMTDRYWMVRDDKEPLNINILDQYQAGEKRSTKNLSGGETFIVSLALALGLSNMTSKTVRVDSLFLDEGFGTLDEEALETALAMLAELRRDGKLIGVISHVHALKERIRTQIRVQPFSGGKSRLSGPGCSS